MTQTPNILYVFADQMRAGSMGCMQDDPVNTPNLDLLASQGVLFSHAYANTPVCTPSRASLLTGKYPIGCRCVSNDIRLPEDQISIADVLNQHGYSCGYIGKWHLDGISRHMFTPPGRRRHGFDAHWAAYNCNHKYFDAKWYENDSPELKRQPGYDADIQTNQAISFLEQNRDNPFCLFLSWGPPHDPYRSVPTEFLETYPSDKLPLRPNMEGVDRELLAGYYAHVTALDQNIGRLMETLDRLNLSQNTIFVFTSDHGDMLWSHGRRNKQQPYEESIHVPLIMRWPEKISPNQKSEMPIGIVDYTPTLLGFANISTPKDMQGIDLSPIILGKSNAEPESVFLAEYLTFDQDTTWQPWRGIRTKRYTYARWLQGGVLLFDNDKDPYQLNNLAIQPGNETLMESLEQELQKWLKRTGDKFLPGLEHIRELGQTEEWKIREEHFHGVSQSNF